MDTLTTQAKPATAGVGSDGSGSGFLKRRHRLYISENNMGAEPPPCLHEEYEPEAGATYLQISRMPVHCTREFRGLVLIDTDERGKLRGLEFVGDGPLDDPNNGNEPQPQKTKQL